MQEEMQKKQPIHLDISSTLKSDKAVENAFQALVVQRDQKSSGDW